MSESKAGESSSSRIALKKSRIRDEAPDFYENRRSSVLIYGVKFNLIQRGHIPVLDGVRGIAIALVLIGHFYPKWLIADSHPWLTLVLGRLVAPSGYGVELFFVLSGFLITGILLDTRNERGFLSKFYARRFLRIFPLYYGALIVVLFILPRLVAFDRAAEQISSNQAWLWTYMANWPTNWIWDDSELFKLGHFWSLCVEEHFYVLWPAAVALLPRSKLVFSAYFLIAVGLISRAAATIGGGDDSIPVFQWTTFQRVDGLAVGALIAITIREPVFPRWLMPGTAFNRGLVISMVGSAIYVFLPRRLHLPVFDVFGESLIVAFFGFVLISALRAAPHRTFYRVLNSKLLLALGKYSYGIYVIHGILRPAFARWFEHFPLALGSPILRMIVYYGFAVGTSFGLAFLSYHMYEKHFLRLKKYFEYTSNSPDLRPKLAVAALAPDKVI